VHRIGRTGRAGKSGRSISLLTPADYRYAPSLVKLLRSSGQEPPAELLDIAGDQSSEPLPPPSQRFGGNRGGGFGGGRHWSCKKCGFADNQKEWDACSECGRDRLLCGGNVVMDNDDSEEGDEEDDEGDDEPIIFIQAGTERGEFKCPPMDAAGLGSLCSWFASTVAATELGTGAMWLPASRISHELRPLLESIAKSNGAGLKEVGTTIGVLVKKEEDSRTAATATAPPSTPPKQEASPPTPTPMTTTVVEDQFLYDYRDMNGAVQGSFPLKKLLEWETKGYFRSVANGLPIRIAGAGEGSAWTTLPLVKSALVRRSQSPPPT